MNKYRAMTYVLVVSNIFLLVAMFIAAFWGFTYPKIVVDGYESGKSAFVAAFMCCVSGICLCGLNFQNYYLLVTYAVLNLMVIVNELFSLLPFGWTRIPNYPMNSSINTQVYITLTPKLLLVAFAFALAYKLRRDEKRYELASTGSSLHPRLPCHVVPRPEPRCQGAPLPPPPMSRPMFPNDHQYSINGSHIAAPLPPPSHSIRMMPPPGSAGSNVPNAPPPSGQSAVMSSVSSIQSMQPPPSNHSGNQIIQTPPIYPLHRPSVTDVSITNSPNRPLPGGMCHRPVTQQSTNCPTVLASHHSNSCGGGLNGIGMSGSNNSLMEETDNLTRTRSSGFQWRSVNYEPVATTPTKWYANNVKQQHYGSYYRDVYNPNF